MKPLNRQNLPPKPGPRLHLWRIEAGPGFRGQIVSCSLFGVWTHWDGHRSRECTATIPQPGENTDREIDGEVAQQISMQAPTMLSESCIGHKEQWPLRWKGYLFVWNSRAEQFGFLELTPGGATELLRQAPSHGNLRGLLLKAERHGKSIRSKVAIELTQGVGDPNALPAAVDPEDTLRALWGWANKR